MHEMSLCESIMRIVEKQATKDDFTRVKKIRIEIGEHSGVSQESLTFCFPHVSKNTIAETAELEFTTTSDNALRVIEIDVA